MQTREEIEERYNRAVSWFKAQNPHLFPDAVDDTVDEEEDKREELYERNMDTLKGIATSMFKSLDLLEEDERKLVEEEFDSLKRDNVLKSALSSVVLSKLFEIAVPFVVKLIQSRSEVKK